MARLFVGSARTAFRDGIVPALLAMGEANSPMRAADAAPDDENEATRRAITAILDTAQVAHQVTIATDAREVVAQHLGSADARNRREVDAQLAGAAGRQAGRKLTARAARRALGVTPSGSEPWLAEVSHKAVANSLANIEWATGQIYERAAKEINEGLTLGLRVEEIAKQIARDYTVDHEGSALAISRRRAMGIARNELGNFTAALTERRHTDLGVKQYRWRTSSDERVRGPGGKYPRAHPSHRARDGKIYSYAKPPKESKDDGHPGKPHGCRCHSEPVFEELEGIKRRSKKKPRANKRQPVPARLPAPPKAKPPAPPKPVAKPQPGVAASDALYKPRRITKADMPEGTRRADKLKEVMTDSDRKILANARKRGGLVPAATAKRIRQRTRGLLAKYDLTPKDAVALDAARKDALLVAYRGGELSASHAWSGGLVTYSDGVVDALSGARGAEERDFAWGAVIHEEIHGHGAAQGGVHYRRDAGTVIEEITTEVTARKVARELGGMDVTARGAYRNGHPRKVIGYQYIIDPVYDALGVAVDGFDKPSGAVRVATQEALGITDRWIERAAMHYKRRPAGSIAPLNDDGQPEGVISAFFDSIEETAPDKLSASDRARIRKVLTDASLR